MKNVMYFLVFSLSCTGAFGAQVKSAELDGSQENILVNVVHGGGCGTHQYSLKMRGCRESLPVSCDADLVHSSNDPCEALLSRTAVFNLKKYGLDESYYSGGTLTIYGSEDGTGGKSKATVRLPR